MKFRGAAVDTAERLLAIGVITNPRRPDVRSWLREFTQLHDEVALRYVRCELEPARRRGRRALAS
jgi:hypothetical protein